jgi:hypothetical protein
MTTMKSILTALQKLNGTVPSFDQIKTPFYREIISDYLGSFDADTDLIPECDRQSAAFRRRAMTANYGR